jgi:dynein heavy chain
MGDTGFIKSLIEFDKDNITAATQKKLQVYIENPMFLPEFVMKQSKAATSLCMWVRAMDVYANVAKIVAPKKAVCYYLKTI